MPPLGSSAARGVPRMPPILRGGMLPVRRYTIPVEHPAGPWNTQHPYPRCDRTHTPVHRGIDTGAQVWYNGGVGGGSGGVGGGGGDHTHHTHHTHHTPHDTLARQFRLVDTTKGNTTMTHTDLRTDLPCTVLAVTRGWTTIAFADGTEAKRRLNELEEITEEEPVTQAQTLAKYRKGYRVSVTGTGRKSQASPLSCVAELWEGHDHGKIAQWASILLGQPVLTLYEKYAHLNNGQMRMNAGNTINARVKRGEIDKQQMIYVMEAPITSTHELDAKHRPERLQQAK